MEDYLEFLRHEVSGAVITSTDEGYDAARASWNLFIDQRPDIIVMAESEADVVAAVLYANKVSVPVTVQATGHGQPKTCAGGVLINTSRLNSVRVDALSRTATIGGGVRWKEVIEAAYPYGLAPISGSSPYVGVIGYTIGGGYGITSRKHGLAVDNVHGFRIVLPSGKVNIASPDENSDLFYATLGGGGSYGVVTEMTLALHEHAEVFGGSVMFDSARASEVYEAYAKWTPTLPDEVTSAIHIMNFPSAPFIPDFLRGRSMVILIACVCGHLDQAEEWLRPMRDLDGGEFDSFHRMPYTESGAIFQDPVDPLPANGRGVLLNEFTPATAKAFLDAVGPIPRSPNLMIQLRHLGGAILRNSNPHVCILRNRKAQYLAYVLGIPTPDSPPESLATHAENVFKRIEPWVLSRGPLNWLGEGAVESSSIRSVFSEEEYTRIKKVKESIDPLNRFSNAGLGIG